MYFEDDYDNLILHDYQDEEDLEVNTLENVVYISMKNDTSFLVDCNMNLRWHPCRYSNRPNVGGVRIGINNI